MMSGSSWKDAFPLLLFVGVCLIVGFSSSLLSDSAGGYTGLDMPPFSPPGWLFPVAWVVLYILMGLSIWSVYLKGGDLAFYILFCIQLALNFAWTPVFFGMEAMGAALVILVGMFACTLLTTLVAWRVNPRAGMLLVPYLAWMMYAMYLNGGALVLN